MYEGMPCVRGDGGDGKEENRRVCVSLVRCGYDRKAKNKEREDEGTG